jgi:hypothetical protein
MRASAGMRAAVGPSKWGGPVVSQLGIRRKPARYPIDRSDPDNLAKQVAVTTWPVTCLDRARCEPINQQCGRVQPRAERSRPSDSASGGGDAGCPHRDVPAAAPSRCPPWSNLTTPSGDRLGG